MYLEYWKLDSHPFSNTPDTHMYFAADQESDPVPRILLSIRDALANLLVLSGEEGTGKTICMRQIVDQLDPHLYNIVFVSNPALSFADLLREITGQLNHRIYPRKTLGYFMQEFGKAVEMSAAEDRRVLVLIDNYKATSTTDLSALHSLLTSKQYSRASLSVIMAGAPELTETFEEPSNSALFHDLTAFYATQPLESRAAMSSYIEHRLQRAGRLGESPFSDSAIDSMWNCTANRSPRALNSICRVCLKKAAQAGEKQIDAQLVNSVGADLNTQALQEVPPPQPLALAPDIKELSVPVPAPLPSTPVNRAKERLASQLANNRIQHLDTVRDPFEAWSAAREEILSTLRSTKLRQAAS